LKMRTNFRYIYKKVSLKKSELEVTINNFLKYFHLRKRSKILSTVRSNRICTKFTHEIYISYENFNVMSRSVDYIPIGP
jgi:hypothetical protein